MMVLQTNNPTLYRPGVLGSINVYPMEVYMLNGLINYRQGIPLISD